MPLPKFEPLSPMWWVLRLHKLLVARRPMLEICDRYYRGDHPLPWLAPAAREEFRRILKMTRSNYMGLVIDAQVERLHVEGFRLDADAPGPDQDSWRIWQANNLDADSDKAFLEAAIGGTSYMLVAPNPDDEQTPRIWVEDAMQAIVEHVPGTNRRERAAGLKVWLDDWTGRRQATLYLPEAIYKFEAEHRSSTAPEKVRWVPREVAGELWPAPNPLGVVPLVELPNNPRLRTGGVSEIADVIDGQDRVNKTVADRLMTQDYGAFPQKWVSGWPTEDEDGNPTQAIDGGRNRVVTTDVAEARFGQWDAAPVDPYSAAKREDVKDIASRTRTPAQYLLGEMSNVNGETLKASESGLISKVRQRMRPLAEGLEETMRIARRAAGLSAVGAAGMETIWRNPEFRTEGELTDAVVKRVGAGLSSIRQGREDLGYSAAQIERMEQDDRDAAQDPVLEHALRNLQPDAAAVGG